MKTLLRQLTLRFAQDQYAYARGRWDRFWRQYIFWVTDGEHHLFG